MRDRNTVIWRTGYHTEFIQTTKENKWITKKKTKENGRNGTGREHDKTVNP